MDDDGSKSREERRACLKVECVYLQKARKVFCICCMIVVLVLMGRKAR